MEISVDLVKQLREISMASLKDCKDCLVEAWGDMEKAQELLKKKGIASAGKKWDREIKEWKVAYLVDQGNIAVLKLWCETDFVAKNELFDQLMSDVLSSVVSSPIDSFSSLESSLSEKITMMIAETIGKLWENMKVVELFVKKLPSEDVYVYTHAWSKLIAVVYYNWSTDDALEAVKKTALQIAAMDPTYLSVESISQTERDQLQTEFESEVRSSGKPEAVVPNIVAGKLQKRYSEVVLMEQQYIGDETQKIKDILSGKATVVAFDRVGFAS